MTRRLLRCVLVVSLAALSPAAAVAQIQTGEIFGRVTDTTGAVLPGAAVTIESPALLRPQTAVSTETGAYRFPNIPIGTYAVRFELAGFKTLVREGIRIETGFNAEINGKLEISTVQETITVSGESPVVDTKQVSTGGNFNREMLENIPSARDPWVILQMTPGIVMSGQNVGGSQSGQQNGYAAHGGGQGNSMWNLDGATITDMAATGASPIYYDFDSFEEMQITTGGSDASMQTGGVNINLVTKSGGNLFKGTGRVFFIDQAMQATNVTQALFDQGATAGNPIQNIKDYGAEVGGPIVRDKAWFWGSYGKQDIKVGVVNFFRESPECNPAPSTFDQLDAIKDCLMTDLTVLENYNAKVQYQPGAAHKLSFLYTYGDKIRNARGAGPLNPPETTVRQTGPVPMYKGTHNWVPSDRLAIESAAMYVGGGFLLDFHEDALAAVQRKFNITTGLNSRSGTRSEFERPTTEIKSDANYFASNLLGGDHALKFGFRWRDTPYDSFSHVGGFATARYTTNAAGQEIATEADLHRDSASKTAMKVASGYISDSYSKGRVRLTLGLRYDWQDDKALAATVPENPIRADLLPSVTFDGADSGVTFRDWSPRAALTYDLRGNGKTIAKASFARYFGQGIFTAGTLNPVTSVQLRYAWTDPNRDGLVQGNELGAFRQLVSGNWNAAAPGSPTTANQVSPDLKNDRTDEIIASLDHELMANFGVGFSYVYRNYDQFQDTFRIGISSADFIPVTYTETDSRFASRTPTVTYYQLRSGLSVPSPRVLRNYNFDRRYHGLELTARKRMSDNWMVNGSLTWNHTREHWTSPDDYTNNTPSADPTNLQFRQDQPGSSLDTRWLLKVGGGYTFPLGINASAFLVGRDGFLRNESVQSPSRPGGLGRINVLFEPQGTNRYPTVWQADARVEKWFTFEKLRIAASLDVFNIGNVDTVVNQGNVRNTTNFGRVFSIIAPRVLRIGARFNF